MLQISKRSLNPARDIAAEETPSDAFGSFVALLRRQYPVMLLVVGLALALGIVYLVVTPPRFTAQAMLVIDSRKQPLLQQQAMIGDLTVDSAAVETQVEVLKSENIAATVIKKLDLGGDPEFADGNGGFIGALAKAVASWFRAAPRTERERARGPLTVFEKRRSIKRVGLTYAIEIGFTSLSPERAAQVANAIAEAYVVDQLEVKYQAAKRASVWLQDRIHELRADAIAAERAVLDFKTKNNIVDTGGRLMNDQQVTEVNSQLVLARAATAEAKARLERIQEIMTKEVPDASVADALKNEVIVRLRNQYLDLAAREASWAARYGSQHVAVVNLRSQMRELRRSIADELGRIAESYKSDYQIAKTREESIENSLAHVVSQSQLTSQAQLGIRELESNAQAYRSLYDNFLQRYTEATQQQSFPITEARLISPASPPARKSQPSTVLVLLVSALGGLLVSFGVALLRELSDKVFRTGAQVEEALGASCLALLPAVAGTVAAAPHRRATAAVPPSGQPPAARAIARGEDLLLWHVVDQPLSRFAESVRSIKVAADLHGIPKSTRVIGVTSSLPNEGKSTVCANVAQLIAHAGARVILVDCDLRNPSLSRRLAPQTNVGLLDVASGNAQLEDAVWIDPATRMAFLPAGATSGLLHSNEVLGSDDVKRLVASLRSAYDYVLVDLPPLAPVVDVRNTTGIIDSYLFVIEWGRTRTDLVKSALAATTGIYDRLLGVVLNKADVKRAGRYEGYHGNYYYKRYYSRYGYAE